jgi:hypothetical protein
VYSVQPETVRSDDALNDVPAQLGHIGDDLSHAVTLTFWQPALITPASPAREDGSTLVLVAAPGYGASREATEGTS